MKAAELLALASAHGIDLKRVAGASSELDGPAAERRLRREERRDGIERVPLSVRGSETRVYRRPVYSHAELGQAAKGVSDLPWYAARFRFAGENEHTEELWSALATQAHRMAWREGWRMYVPGRLPRAEPLGPPLPGSSAAPHLYRERLALLVLEVERFAWAFRAVPGLYAWRMDVEERTWSRVLEPRFASLQAVFERWVGTAIGMIQRRMAERAEGQELRAG